MLYQRGNIWWYSFRKDGVRYQVSTGSTNKEVAKRAEARKITELDEQRNNLPTTAKPLTLRAEAPEWLAVKRAKWGESNLAIQNYNLAHLNQHFGAKLLPQITADAIGKYQAIRQDEGASNRTINMEIATLRMILKWKKRWGRIADDVTMLEEDATPGKQLNADEAAKLLEACRRSPQPSLLTAVIVFSNTGLRNGELRKAKWHQVDFLRNPPMFTVAKRAKTKGSAGREIPLNQDALEAFKEWKSRWPNAKPDDYIFPSEKLRFKGEGSVERNQMTGYAVDRTRPLGGWKTAWRTAKKQAGVECRMHDLRHDFISKLGETETPGSVIESLAGHMSAAMRKRYTHISQSAKVKAVASIDRHPAPAVQ